MTKWKRRKLLLAGMMILVLSQLQGGLTFAEGENTLDVVNEPLTIALDPGHGGEENGAYYYGLREKDANLKIAKLVQQELSKYPGVTVVLTRDSDEEVGLQTRVIRAADAGADVFISLHLNAGVSHRQQGATIYVTTGERYRQQMCDMADCLLGEFEAVGLNNNGTIARMTQLGGRRADGSFDDYYGVLRHSYNYGMPSLLIEHCFMDSETDRKFLQDEEGLKQLAKADANGIAAYYGLKDEEGNVAAKKQEKVYGGTTAGNTLNSYEPPQVTGISLVEYDGKSPGLATYEVEVEDENSVTSLYLVYQNEEGASFTVSLILKEGLATGTHKVTGYIPEFLTEGSYSLSYIGASNEAGYEVGYNYANGEMVGFGKCVWQNTFFYQGEGNIEIQEQGSVSSAVEKLVNYQIEQGLRDKRNRYPGVLYPD
jgi:N-acetylmuramoyl-L-alanine amidase